MQMFVVASFEVLRLSTARAQHQWSDSRWGIIHSVLHTPSIVLMTLREIWSLCCQKPVQNS
jgi:hypothetical protein